MPRPARMPRHGAALTAVAALAALVLAGCGSGAGSKPSASRSATPPSRPASSADTSAAAAAAAARARAKAAATADATLTKVIRSVPEHAAGIAALDTKTGKSVVEGSRRRMWTASMYKLLVLETLLRENGPLGGELLDEAREAIEQSDNVAGYALWEAGGGNGGLQHTMRALGMKHSEADGTDPTFTKLTAPDALLMARALVRPGVLSPAARAQALGLMRNVESDQRWGVGAAADRGSRFANKNGWLSIGDDNGPGEDDGGRWAVTSVGVMTVHGHQVLMAAMTNHDADMQRGVDAIESMSKAAATLLGL